MFTDRYMIQRHQLGLYKEIWQSSALELGHFVILLSRQVVQPPNKNEECRNRRVVSARLSRHFGAKLNYQGLARFEKNFSGADLELQSLVVVHVEV